MARCEWRISYKFFILWIMMTCLYTSDAVSVDANFNMNGVKGFITLSQQSPANPTAIKISLSGLDQYPSETFPWHIHNYPFTTQKRDPCSAASVGGHFNPFMANSSAPNYSAMCSNNHSFCQVGDLSGKFGRLNASSSVTVNFIDDNLPLYGVHSIVGRSVVIHRSNGDRWVCANIEYPGNVTVAYSPFRANLIGNIFFIEPYPLMNLTTVFVQLSYISGSGSSSLHGWYVYNNPIGSDGNCEDVGNHYNPGHISTESTNYSFCSPSNQFACQVGDLTRKSSKLDFSDAAHSMLFYTDINLPIRVIRFNETILGRSVVIHPEKSNPTQIACANLSEYSPRIASAKFQEDGVTGQVVFKQSSPFSPTVVRIILNGLSLRASGYQVHEFPVDETIQGSSRCTAAGGHYNPRNITRNSSSPTTFDAYEMGDLSGKSSQTLTGFKNLHFTYTDPYLPLFGTESIVGRSVVIYYPNGDRWLCANILYDKETVSITAVITTDSVQGRLVLTQLANDPFSETIIFLELNIGPPVVSGSTVQVTPTPSTSMTIKASTNGSSTTSLRLPSITSVLTNMTTVVTIYPNSTSMTPATNVMLTSSVLTTAMTTTPQSSMTTNTSSISAITSSTSTIIIPTETSHISNTTNTIFSSSTKTVSINATSFTSTITASSTKTTNISSSPSTSTIAASSTKTAKINSTSTTSTITASPTKTTNISSSLSTSTIATSSTETISSLSTSTSAASSTTTISSLSTNAIAASSTTTTSSLSTSTIATSSPRTTSNLSTSTIAASSTPTTSSLSTSTIATSSTITTSSLSTSTIATSSTITTSSLSTSTIAASSTKTTSSLSTSTIATSSTPTTSSLSTSTIATSSTKITSSLSTSTIATSSPRTTSSLSTSTIATSSTITTSSLSTSTIAASSTPTTSSLSTNTIAASSPRTTSSLSTSTIATSSPRTTSSLSTSTIAASSTLTTNSLSTSTIATSSTMTTSSLSTSTIAASSTLTTNSLSTNTSAASSTPTTSTLSTSTIATSSPRTTSSLSISTSAASSPRTTSSLSTSTIAASSTKTTDTSSSLSTSTSNAASSSPSKTPSDQRKKAVLRRETNTPPIYLSIQNSCEPNASVVDPYSTSTSCSSDNQLACPVGNLTGKHGPLSLGRNLLIDINLPLTGPNSIAGKAVVVRIGDGDSLIVKCMSLPTPVLPSTATNTATTSKSLPSTPTATSIPDKDKKTTKIIIIASATGGGIVLFLMILFICCCMRRCYRKGGSSDFITQRSTRGYEPLQMELAKKGKSKGKRNKTLEDNVEL